MFLQLNHQNLGVYKVSRKFVTECYKLTRQFPAEERFNLVQQIRRAAISVHLNLAEGASRKSAAERKRYYEISRGSIIEIDAALDTSSDLNYCDKNSIVTLGDCMVQCFRMLTGMINSDKPSL